MTEEIIQLEPYINKKCSSCKTTLRILQSVKEGTCGICGYQGRFKTIIKKGKKEGKLN